MHSPFRSWLAPCLLLAGCSPPAAPPDVSAPTPGPVPTPAAIVETPRPSLMAAAPATPIPPRATPEPVENAHALEARYFAAGTSLEQRSETIQLLGTIATPAAGEVLLHIFEREKRLETRMEAVQVAAELPDETCRDQKLFLLRQATAPTHPQLVRLTSLNSLADSEDPRVVSILRTLATDRDPAIREQATELLKARAP